MPEIVIEQIPCLHDNYGYLVHVVGTDTTLCIDTPDAETITRVLSARNWSLSHILNTHWHDDHAGGNQVLKDRFGATVIGPVGELDRIPTIDRPVAGGDRFEVAGVAIEVIDVGGHTSGHIAYWLPHGNALFSGDALFALGCGRVFEGTHAQAWQSLLRLRALAGDTLVYCAHEYTAANAAFAITVNPNNQQLHARCCEIARLRASGTPTVPFTIALERETNPFLRPEDIEIRSLLNLLTASDEAVFSELRTRKDNFRG